MKSKLTLQHTYSQIGRKMHLLLRTGQLLMESGADTNRIVRDLKRTAAYMGIPEEKINMHVMYTTLMLNVSDGDHSYTKFRKCQHHGVNMTIISALSKLTWRALENSYTLGQYETELNRVECLKRHYSPALTMTAAGIACGSFSLLFGGDMIAFFCTAISATFAFWLRHLCNSWKINPYASVAIAAFTATVLAYLTQFFANSATPWHPMIACALFIVPGIPLINAVDDMLHNYIVAGMTRAMNTLLIGGSMTFGIILAIRLCQVDDFTSLNFVPDSLYLLHPIAAAIAAVGFSILFNVPPRLLIGTAIGGVIAVCLRNYLSLEFGVSQTASSFIGATVVSLIALKAVHWFHTPVHVLTIPSVIPLIPGVLLYRLLFAVININELNSTELLSAMQNGVTAILIIVSISVAAALPNLFARRLLERSKQIHLDDILAQRKHTP